MKKYALLTVSCAFALLAAFAAPEKPDGKAIALFDGKTLDGWSHFLVDSETAKEDVWSADDGVLVCKGEPLGYLYTDKAFQDFHLTLEWRWAPGTKPGNSGVLLRIAGDAISFLPKCVEAQLQNGSAGDIWAFYGAGVEGDADRIQKVEGHKDLGDFHGLKGMERAEKKPGKWNRYDITMKGGDLELKINGKLVNRASGLDVLAGPIGLQSEGGEIHFRNIKLEAL